MSDSVDFSAIAKQSLDISPLMHNRVKISTDELMELFPDGVTLNNFDLLTGKNNTTYPIFTLAEDDSVFYYGGYLLSKIIDSFIAQYCGDIIACQQHFATSGGIKVKLSWATSVASENRYVNVDVL